jgi:hypothetical protein
MASSGGNPGSRDVGLRASDADRERVAQMLREHYSAGRLSDEDLSERVETAYAARTTADLATLTEDLPSSAAPAQKPPPRRRRGVLERSVRVHATVYLVVNVMLIAIWAAAGGGYFWPIWSILGWGIGLGCHAAPYLAGRGHQQRHDDRRELESSVDEVAASVAAERPSLRPAAAPDGTVTIQL